MGEQVQTVNIKSEWLREFIRERDKKFYVVQIIAIVG